MDSSIKQKTIRGILWSFCERFGSLFILFISNIVLARILSPDDFGLIGMMMVLIAMSNVLIDGGLGAALIQRKNPTSRDYSTVFYMNVAVALSCYFILFLFSKNIADFYSQSKLDLLLKVLGLVMIIDSFGTVQNNILIKNLNFKGITIIKISSAIISVSSAIILALNGYGVWSLVFQYLINSLTRSTILWCISKWRPNLCFSLESFKTLFNFSSKLLAASLLSEGYRNLQLLVIGRFFPTREVGYFTQARQLESVPVQTIMSVINQVTFPVFSMLQDSKNDLLRGLRRCFKVLAYLNFPLMILLIIIAKPLIIVLFTEKWLPAVPYFQWLCGGFGLLLVIHNISLNGLKAVGRSDIVLYLEIVKKILGISFIFFFLKYGVIGILWALALNSFIEFFMNGYFTGKYLKYNVLLQIKDLFPILLYSVSIGFIVFNLSMLTNLPPMFLLVFQIILFLFIYVIGSVLLKMEIAVYIKNEILQKIKK